MNIQEVTKKIEIIKNSFRIAYGGKRIKNFNEKERYRLNKAIQLVVGFGKDKITINEPSSYKNLEKYKTIYQLDKANFEYQEKIFDKNKRKKYKDLTLSGEWFRVINNKKLIYGNLWSVDNYIVENIIEKLNSKLNKVIPNIEIITDELFKPANDENYKNAFVLNQDAIELRAFGREKEYENLYNKINSNETYQDIKNYINKYFLNRLYDLNNSVFYTDIETNENWDVIIGQRVSKQIKFQSFLKDLDKYVQPFEIINIFIEDVYKQYERKVFK